MEITEIEAQLGDIVRTCYDIEVVNKLAKNEPERLVAISEKIVQDQIDRVVDRIMHGDYKFLLISGPSSSGKTTTANQVISRLRTHGKKAMRVSLDDFFLDLDKCPVQEDGTVDLETINKIDLPCFNIFFQEIMTKNKAYKPIFNFVENKREKTKELIEVGEGDLIVVEGTHALNPQLIKTDDFADKILRVYACVNSEYKMGKEIIINSRKIRLIRRLMRDMQTRGRSAEDTINYWNVVSRGEDKYVAPFKNTADFIVDTTHIYELSIYDKLVPKILEPIKQLPYAQELLQVFSKVGPMQKEYVPENSVLWEFLVNMED